MSWHDVIADFTGMVGKTLERETKYRVTKELDCDKNTVERYEGGAEPSSPDRVARFIDFALRHGIDISEFQTFSPLYDFSPMQTYERRLEKGPPDFSWLTRAQTLPQVRTDFCDIALDSPIGIASSPLTGDDRWSCSMLDLGYGLSFLKTRRAGQWAPYDPPLIASVLEPPDLISYDSTRPPEVLVTPELPKFSGRIPDLVNSIGVPSESPAVWRDLYLRIKEHPRGKFVGVSVMGDGDDVRAVISDFGKAVSAAKDVHPPAVEINPSCPNLEKKCGDLCTDLDLLAEICRKARESLNGVGIPLVVKLPRLPSDKLRPLVGKIGRLVQAFSYGNTIRVRPVRSGSAQNRRPAFNERQFGGLSGPCTFGTTLRGTQVLSRLRNELRMDFQIIAVGGVTTPAEVVQLLNAGAGVVQVCTVAMFDPLFAWKVRHHLSRPNSGLQRPRDVACSPEEQLTILAPFQDHEIASYNNATKARKLIAKRLPGHAISDELFKKRWDAWMRSQVPDRIGVARRPSAAPRARTVDEWIREFSG
jgi:dihydroorotate dehydrogenase (NAD+) catalytic subunit